jgi:hypothetical protein
MTDLTKFQADLTQALEAELRLHQPRLASETVRIFDLGCFPWHGTLELSFLTDHEPRLNTRVRAAELVAEWRLYNFVPAWPRAQELGSGMRAHWTSASEKKIVADQYFRACASAVCSSKVAGALDAYHRSSDFVVRVADPDDHAFRNYCVRN